MSSFFLKTAIVLTALSLTSASPTPPPIHEVGLAKRLDCTYPASGLSSTDCKWMSQIGMASQGINAGSNNGIIWLGSDGPNTFTFTNTAGTALVLVMWLFPAYDYEASFMNKRTPYISYSLPNTGKSVVVSVANGISGAWSSVKTDSTTLSQYGQIYNTWGEFTTGNWATVQVSREVYMAGDSMSIKVTAGNDPGCVSDMSRCVFQCKGNNITCGEPDTYELVNCTPGTQKGANYGLYWGQPSGGCQGWNYGGNIAVSLQ